MLSPNNSIKWILHNEPILNVYMVYLTFIQLINKKKYLLWANVVFLRYSSLGIKKKNKKRKKSSVILN